MEATTLYAPEMAREKFSEFPGAAEVKVLRDCGPGKAKTLLVRLPPGGRVTPHGHLGAVQHYVLEGEYECEGKIYGAGVYRLLPGHADAPEITTQCGATILMIYDPLG